MLAQAKSRADELQHQLGLNRDGSWYLTDDRGIQRWREPQDEKTFDKDFSYRDYFHGLGEQFEEATIPPNIQPITKPHVSLSYKSQATGLNMVSLTVPVWDEQHERVIGVLGRSMQLGQLLSPYVPGRHRDAEVDKDDENTDSSRKIVLIDDRNWQLLDHPWISDKRRDDSTKDDLPELRLSDATIALLRPTPTSGEPAAIPVVIQMRDYLDPVGQFSLDAYGGEWLAAFSRVGNTGWFAIVQERKSAVLRPVDAMAARLRRDGAWALLLSGVLIGTLWLVVLRGLKERSERTPLPITPDRAPDLETSSAL